MRYEPLNDGEANWIRTQIQSAVALTEARTDLPSLEQLDQAFAAFTATGDDANSRANEVIMAIGIAFGEHLVHSLNFSWTIASDEYGTDVAVVAQPGNVTIFPTGFVSKRWEAKETNFLVAAFAKIAQTKVEVRNNWRNEGTQK
ncbi:MAG: DUF3806 domain-containing protein [Pirellulales bacterium]